MIDPTQVHQINQTAVVALTQGVQVPSARFRVLQHLDTLKRAGLVVHHLPARYGAYPPLSRSERLRWLPAAIADAIFRALQARHGDICFLQRELVSTLQTAEPLIRRPLVFDVDDAIFLHPRGRLSDRIARRAALIICGNRFLAEHYAPLAPVTILPTAVDTDRFTPAERPTGPPIIGWSGSSSGFPYLQAIEDALRATLERHPTSRLHIVADAPPPFTRLPADRVDFIRWSPDIEVQALRRLSVGLMPLVDDPWARGKCSFKMLTYMSVGIPVVVSPVGMNSEVLAHGRCGFSARTSEEWVDAMSALIVNRDAGTEMGEIGRRIAEEHYSHRVIGPRLAQILKGVV